MTTLHVVDAHIDRNDAVARRLREKLAGINMSRRELSRLLGESHTWATARAAGRTPLSVPDLDRIEAATGISADYLFTGTEKAPQPGGPGGNMQHKDYKIAGSHLQLVA